MTQILFQVIRFGAQRAQKPGGSYRNPVCGCDVAVIAAAAAAAAAARGQIAGISEKSPKVKKKLEKIKSCR